MSQLSVHGPLVVRIVARLFPLRQTLPPGKSLEELKRTYLKWERINALEFILLAIAAVYAVHAALVWYGAKQVRSDPAAVFVLRPGPEFWYFPASLLGCVIAGVLVRLLNRAMLPEGGREFRCYSNVNAGLNVSGMFGAIAVVAVAFGALLSYFAASNEVLLRQNDMMIHRLWSFNDETHSYTDITAIRNIHNPQENHDDFEIDFANDEPWTTHVEVVFFTAQEMDFLARRSGKPIQQLVAQ